MDIFNFDMLQVLSFVLTLMRTSLIVFMLPIFNMESMPAAWKSSLCIVLTLALFPHVSLAGVDMPAHPFNLALMMLGELILGLILSLAIRFFFEGFRAGGEVIAMQMGFSMINFADPLSGNQTGIISHFFYMIITLSFLALDGHLYMLKGFAETFKYIPAGGLFIGPTILNQMLLLSAMLFTLAVKIIAPVMAVLFLIELSLGLMGRAAPQIQLMELSFPLKISVGFFFIGMLFYMVSEEVRQYIINMDDLFINLIRALSPIYN